MKRIWKIVGLIILLGMIACFSTNMFVYAETIDQSLSGGFSWSYDTETKTVTLHGTGSFPHYSNALFGEYTNDIENLIMDETLTGSETGFFWKNDENSLPALKIAKGSLGNGFSWVANYEDDTLFITGKGELVLSSSGSTYLFPQMKTCILGDEITNLNTNGKYMTFSTLQLGAQINIDSMLLSENKFRVTDSYRASANNPYYSVYDGVLYSKDYSILLSCPSGKTSISFHPDVTKIQSFAFNFSSIVYGENLYQTGFADSKNTLVIPWGVKVIEANAFRFDSLGSVTLILPDTLDKIEIDPYLYYLYSKNNLIASTQQYSSSYKYKVVDSIASYYGFSPNSFKTFGSKTYYFDENCKMVTGTVTIEGKTYTFDENGVLQSQTATVIKSGLIYQDGKAYYYENGVMQKSKWVYADGNWYYLNDYGAGVVNCWRLSGGKYYYLGADGKMKTNCWIQDYGSWYYVKADGSRYESSWAKIGGVWYWFGGSGKMAENQWLKLADGKWYHFTSSGAMSSSAWILSGGKWYYVDGSGAMVANKWVKSGSYWYYLGSDGAMLTNTTTPDGYRVDAEGRWK